MASKPYYYANYGNEAIRNTEYTIRITDYAIRITDYASSITDCDP